LKVVGRGFDDEVLDLVIKSLAMGWPCQFVLVIVHQADSHVTVSCQCLSGNVGMSLLLKVLIWADFGLVCLGIVPLSQKSLD